MTRDDRDVGSRPDPGVYRSGVLLTWRDHVGDYDRFIFASLHGPLHVLVKADPAGTSVHVSFVGYASNYDSSFGEYVAQQRDENRLGIAAVRQIFRAIRDAYPDATHAWGYRVGGVRAAGGYDEHATFTLRQPPASPTETRRVAPTPAPASAPGVLPSEPGAPRARPSPRLT